MECQCGTSSCCAGPVEARPGLLFLCCARPCAACRATCCAASAPPAPLAPQAPHQIPRPHSRHPAPLLAARRFRPHAVSTPSRSLVAPPTMRAPPRSGLHQPPWAVPPATPSARRSRCRRPPHTAPPAGPLWARCSAGRDPPAAAASPPRQLSTWATVTPSHLGLTGHFVTA